VIELLYEHGSADFILMQIKQGGTIKERLATFHPVDIPKMGNVIAIHMMDDEKLVHYRRWGEPYFAINSIKGQAKLRIIGIANQRFIVD
jgi:hypothetical protein